jgi:hypothetical protein
VKKISFVNYNFKKNFLHPISLPLAATFPAGHEKNPERSRAALGNWFCPCGSRFAGEAPSGLE